MKSLGRSLLLIAILYTWPYRTLADEANATNSIPYTRWQNGPPADPAYFPIAVWLQDPKNAERYKAAGINLYVGLWRGPNEAQLAALEKAGISVICGQNERGLANKTNRIIVGWMHGDEPDNAQSLGQGKGYGPPITPETIIRNYERMRAADPTRPVLLNLGQGVAWDNYIGRGVRRNHPEDYPEYVKGCDIASFDIYPAVHPDKAIAGKLEYVAQGVERLVKWNGGGTKPTWNCIECTRISNTEVKPTPHQVRAEVWMSIIHGSRGLIYFVHQFEPNFREAALLDDPEMLAAVTAINRQVRELAPVLNSPTIREGLILESSPKEVPVACLMKRYRGATYLFAVNMRNHPVRVSFGMHGGKVDPVAEVLEESRTIPVRIGFTRGGSLGNANSNDAKIGEFADDFKPYEVHLYRLAGGKE